MGASRLAIAAALILAFAPVASADFKVGDIVDVIEDKQPSEKGKTTTDVVIVSEGYQDRAEFLKKARSVARELRRDKSSEVMREVCTFDFYYVWVPSSDAGAPWRTGEDARETPFGAHVTKDGTIATDDGAVDRAVKHVLKGSTHEAVSVVLIHLLSKDADKANRAPTGIHEANDGPDDVRDLADTPEELYRALQKADVCRNGGSEIGRVRQVDLDLKAFVHEFGHARFGLDDEYANDPKGDDEVPVREVRSVAQYPNTTTDPRGLRWRTLVPELFDANGTIKSIEAGGGGHAKGIWHAEHLCRMKQTRTEGFCRVCQAIIRGVNDTRALMTAESVTARVTDDADKKGKSPVEVTWTAGAGVEPTSWHIDVVDADGKVRWRGDVEGHLRTASVKVPADGSYTVKVYAQRVGRADPHNRSAVSETALDVANFSGPIEETLANARRAGASRDARGARGERTVSSGLIDRLKDVEKHDAETER